MIPSSELNWARQQQQEVGHSPLLSSSWHTSEHPQQEDWPSDQGLAAPLFHNFHYSPTSAAKPSAPGPPVIQHQDWEGPNNWDNTMILAAHHPPHHHHHHPTNAATQSTGHDHVEDRNLNIAITQAEPHMSSISRHYQALLSSGVNPSSSLSAGSIAQAPHLGWGGLLGGRGGAQQHSLWMQEEDNPGPYNLAPYSSTSYNGGSAGVVCDNNNLSLYIDHNHSNGSAADTGTNNTRADHAARLDLLGLGSLDQRRVQDIMVKRELPGTCDLINSRIGLNLGGRTYFSAADNHEDSFYGWMGKFGKRFRHGGGGLGAHPMTPVPNCQADGCNADLSMAKHYHRRHKVCAFHSKSPTVSIAGQTQRFCQQCSRFHALLEFDDVKRSCRKRLADHNRRRRKPPQQPPPAGATSPPASAATAATSADAPPRRTTSDEDDINHDRHNHAGNQSSKEDEWPLLAIPLTSSESLVISQERNNVIKIIKNEEDDNEEDCDSDEPDYQKDGGPSLSLTTNIIGTSLNDVATHRQQNVHDAYGGTSQWLRHGSSRENALMEVVASRSLHGITHGGNMDKSLTLNTAFTEISENHPSMNFSSLQGLRLPHNKSMLLENNM